MKTAKLRVIGSSLGKVYTNPRYYLITGVTAFAVMVFYVTLTNVPLIVQAIASGYAPVAVVKIIFALLLGIEQAAGLSTAATIVASAVLVGVNVSLLVYRIRAYGFRAREGGSSLGGFVAGAFGAGCPACATGLLSFLGVTGGLAVLPLQGWEVRAMSFILLLLPIYWLSKDIANNGGCPVRT